MAVTEFPYAPLMTVLSATLLSIWSGWGLARLTLPEALRGNGIWLTPLYGYVLNLVISYWWFRTSGGLSYALVTVLVLGAVLNTLAWRRGGRPQPGRPARSDLALTGLLLLSLAVGIAPQLNYGTPALIGGGWDVENYVPTAVYAQRGSLADIVHQPDNPLRDANADPARNGLTLGFSLTLGLVTLPIGQPPLFGFSALLAWLRVLGLLAVFVTLRGLLQLRPWPALAGTALTAAGSLLLWVSYFNFGMQLSAWPLLPLGLLLGALTLPELARDGRRAWPRASGLVLTAAALPICYYPVLGSLAGPAVLLGAWLLWQSPVRVRLAAAAAAVAAAAVLPALPTIPDYFAGFSYRYSLPLTTLGIFQFVPLSEILGISPYLFRAAPSSGDAAVWGGLLLWGGLACFGVLRGGAARMPLLALLIGSALFLLQIRFGSGYHYGYLKAAAYSGWVAAAAAAVGLQALADLPQRWWRRAAAVGAALLIGQAALAQGRVVAAHWPRAGLYGDELPAMLALRELVPAGATVSFSGDGRPAGTSYGLAALLLDHAVVWGNVRTGYTGSMAGPTDMVGEYGLLQRDEEPTSLGYAAPALAELGPFRLYRRLDGLAARLSLEAELQAGEELRVSVGGRGLAEAPAAAVQRSGPAAATLVLHLALPQRGSVQVNGTPYAFEAGLQRLTFPTAGLDGTLTVRSDDGQLLVRSVELFDAAATAAQQVRSGVISSGRVERRGDSAIVGLHLEQQQVGPIVAALDIWDRQRGRQYGWFGVQLPAGTHALEFVLQPALAQMQLNGTEEPLAADVAALEDGTYTASLRIGTNRESFLRPRDLFEFTLQNGAVTTLEPLVNRWLMAGELTQPPQLLGLEAQGFGQLLGISPGVGGWRAGDTQQITLWWQAQDAVGEASVLVQLYSESGERILLADGPPASGARPTSTWRNGELVLDTRTLKLPADLAAGTYRLRLGLYRWPELSAVPLRDRNGSAVGDTIDVTVEVKDEGRRLKDEG